MITVGPLENEHVKLVPMTEGHVDALTAAATGDRSGFDLAPIPRNRDEMVSYVGRALAEQESNRSVPFVAEHGGRVVGSYRLMSLEWWTWREGPIHVAGEPRVAPTDPPDVAEIGHVWISKAVQRTVVNRAALHLLMGFAFDVWRVHRLVWKTDARNTRSRNTILSVGGHFEGIMRSHTPSADGLVRDVALFSVLPAEWPAVRLRLESALSATHNH
jgi:RimJ/RimL family protein N-acetyltransferase